ncbi:MAG: ATP-binding cassette domain-containing protein [Thermoguttaceae bacterium]|jgi:ABC-type polysaccharide/polyol phosphate transport system ATPase subunit
MPSTTPPAARPVVIRASSLGKCYRLYARPADRLKQALFGGRRAYYDEHWSLRDVSFEIARGEKVGIVGRNGAGKSTLLKVLAGILAPTEGEVRRTGTVFPLLELGIGFDPEFTGRENLCTSGSVFGLSRAELEALIPQIIAFADIGEYLDQPVKTYSSGMFARLAMALALHLRADLLLIDEILSVGDVFFQTKCFQRIEALLAQGSTVLICSHDLGAVRRYCSRVLYFANGRLAADGPPDEVLGLYLKMGETSGACCARVGGTGAGATGSASAFPVLPDKPGNDRRLVAATGAGTKPGTLTSSPHPGPLPTGEGDFLGLELKLAAEWQPDDAFRAGIRNVRGIVPLDNGNLLVADLFHHALQEITRRGRLVRPWTQKGFATQELYDPVGLELRPGGGIVAADYTTGRIAAVAADGRLEPLLAHAQLGAQPFLARYAPDGKLWIFSRVGGLQVFADESARQGRSVAPRPGWLPTDVAFRAGEAYVADFRHHQIEVLDGVSAAWKRSIPLPSLAARAPHGLAFRGDALLVTCHDSNTLVVFPQIDQEPGAAACLSLAGAAVNHPCYLLAEGERVYISTSTLGGMLALDVGDWPHSIGRQS